MSGNTGARREADFSQSGADVKAGWTSGIALVFGITCGLGGTEVTASEAGVCPWRGKDIPGLDPVFI